MNFEYLLDERKTKQRCKSRPNESCYWIPTGNIIDGYFFDHRHILIKTVEDDSDGEPLIVLPDDYKPKKEKHTLVQVLNSAEDVRFDLKNNPRIIVDQSMIEEISINNTIYRIIQDNYVIGIID